MKLAIALGLATALGFAPLAASAGDVSGHDAIALASLVGSYSPNLTTTQKAALAAYLASSPDARVRSQIVIAAKTVTCGVGNVDITRAFCDLTFAAVTRRLTGRAASELYGALAAAGVEGEGAAGTLYEGVTELHCVLDPSEISQGTGGGASCTYQPS